MSPKTNHRFHDDAPILRGARLPSLRRALLRWYDRNKRDLPWRRTRDPYAIFVSEMMLQQTQVKTVLPYYDRWMKALPSWRALDRAPMDRVLKLWEGLGYYRRARNLKTAARRVMEDFGGHLPSEEADLRSLPGVGPYSAGALLSIAFQHPAPLVDGNVERVYARLFAQRGDLKKPEGRRWVWDRAGRIVDPRRPGDFNQALMELGATVCLPDAPECERCPWQGTCQGCISGHADTFPMASASSSSEVIHLAVAVITRGGHLLLRRRPATSRWWEGLWELPTAEGRTTSVAKSRLKIDLNCKELLPLPIRIRHTVTRHLLLIKAYRAVFSENSISLRGSWAPLDSPTKKRPLSAAHIKVLTELTRLSNPKTPQPSARRITLKT